MKELKEDCWRAIGENSGGEEAFGALFKKIGEIGKEATKELQGLKQRHRTANIDKRIEDCERRINRLQKADDNLLYHLRILAIGCQKKLENIKEGKVKEVKTEVKKEPESQDQVIPAVDVSQKDAPILMEEAVEEEMTNYDPENQNQELPGQTDFGGRIEDHLEESPDDSALVATPKPILEVLKLVDDLDKCLEEIGKVQSETKELFCSTDDPKEISQLAQQRIALVQLANLIPQRLKELKEEGWKAMGEKSEGEETIGALFKKIGKTREEATKDIQCLKQCRRTAKIDEEIEDREREVRRLQKAEDRLLYDVRDLGTGCQMQLENIKEGRAVEEKTDVKEPVSRRLLDEPPNQNQDSTHRKVKEEPEEEETAPIDCNQGDARGYEFDDSHANDDQPPEDSPIRLHQTVKKRKRLFESDEEASDGESLGAMVDSEDEAVVVKKGSKMKKRGLLATPIKNKSKEIVTGGNKKEEEGERDEDDDMLGVGLGRFDESDDGEPTSVKDSVVKAKKGNAGGYDSPVHFDQPPGDLPISFHQEPAKKRGRLPVLTTKSKGKKKEAPEGEGTEEMQMKEPERRRRSARKANTVTYFEEKEKEGDESSSEESDEESSGRDGDEEWNEKNKKRRRMQSEGDASDQQRGGTTVDSEDQPVLASPIKNKKQKGATGGKTEVEREMDEDDDMMKGGLGGFYDSDDNEPTPVKNSAVNAKKRPLRRVASLSGNNKAQDDVDMEDSADDDESEKEDQDEMDCPVDGCSEKSSSDEALRKHMRTHPHPLICRVCKKALKNAFTFRRHQMTHSGTKPFTCSTCGKRFSRSANLREHTRQHTGVQPYECDLCGEKFKNSSSLDYHRRKHNKETMFPCNVCDYRSASSGCLKVHMRTHTGEKPFKCTDCGHCFSQKAHMEEHKAGIHTAVKKHACKECDFKTAYTKALYAHKKRVHQK